MCLNPDEVVDISTRFLTSVFVSLTSFPLAPEYVYRGSILNFYENSRSCSKVKVNYPC
jgi:hypothetical protein